MEIENMETTIRRKRGAKGRRLLLIIAAALAATLLLLIIMDRALIKPLRALAAETVLKNANDAVNLAVIECGTGDTGDIAVLETDSSGNSFLRVDASKLNSRAAEIAVRAQEKLASVGKLGVEIPLGSATGSAVLTGTGSMLRVEFSPTGNVTQSMRSSFTSAGVNQTKYSVYLTLKSEIAFVLAGRSECVEVVHTEILFETIIVGGVPQAYTNIDSVDDALNLLPTAE